MAKWQYTKGLHELGNGCYAWLQPDGSWGYSNSGLVVDEGEALLVDTLFDLAHTREMLDAYRAAAPAAQRIGTLVNTHSNGDHTFGNQLVGGARIIASRACAEEMAARPPEERAAMARNWRAHGATGAALNELYGGRFDFEGVVHTPPTEVFESDFVLRVGAKEVRLVNVGPAHTRGDVLVHVLTDRTAYTGDILFINGHPAVWAGPVSNWIRACEVILSWDVDVIVPGHGPITDKNGVRSLKRYFEYLVTETRKRYESGMSEADAARDIALDEFRGWLDDERIVVNVNALYREFAGTGARPDTDELHARMAAYRKERRRMSVKGNALAAKDTEGRERKCH